MANVIFEQGTQLQASSFTAGDTLLFTTAAPSDVGVTYNAASGFNVATVTLTVGEQSLTFAASALGAAQSHIEFFAEDGQLVIGTEGTDASLSVTSDADSVAYGFDGTDTFTVSGDGDHIVYGGTGGDTITVTGSGNHNLFGDAGDDTITATAATGNLNIFGGAGKDIITGGTGNDHLYGQSAAGGTDVGDVISGGNGNDYIQGNAGDDSLTGGLGNDRINGGADKDSIDGGLGNDVVNGNKGADTIFGNDGDDSLRGGADNDVIGGGNGNDVILGDLGDDTITGGAGVDLLTGGEGSDHFVFLEGDVGSGTEVDDKIYYETITDFNAGDDTLSLEGYNVTDETIVLQNDGVSFTKFDAALDYVEGVLTTSTAANTVAAIQVGADTYLFYEADGDYATLSTDGFSVLKLTGVTAADLTEDNFAVLPA